MKRAPLLALGAIALAAGCAHPATKEPSAPAARESARESPTCAGLGALVDLHGEIATVPTTAHAPLAPLADVQAELAAARAALGVAKDDPSLHSSIEHLASLLEGRHAKLTSITHWSNESHAVAVAALRDASTCRGVDLQAVAKRKDKTEDLAIARSKACEGTLRLWAVTDGLDLASAVSTARVAAQVGDVRATNAQTRDRLKAALARHAKNLQALEEASDPTALTEARDDVKGAVAETYRACLTQPPPAKTAASKASSPNDPRRATVMVRPSWSGALKRLPSAAGLRFGSGFVVRWHEGTYVVTNRHVMDGAVEAEILFASDVENARRDRKTTRLAKLVAADASDDVAVLRIDDGKDLTALSFRLEPAREQESVVAAGFPGIGAMPSFQVTRGVVSNAHFASEAEDAGIAYLQHTAAIDPGNSGGPLLDDNGRLIGMNTAKMTGRENVSFAIPTSRVRFALTRAERPRRFDPLHAEAACNVALDGLASEHPSIGAVRRWGLALFEEAPHHARSELRAAVESPIDEARVRAFERVRDAVDAEGGMAPFATCSDVAARDDDFVANVRTRGGATFRAVLASETDELRVVSFAQVRGGT